MMQSPSGKVAVCKIAIRGFDSFLHLRGNYEIKTEALTLCSRPLE